MGWAGRMGGRIYPLGVSFRASHTSPLLNTNLYSVSEVEAAQSNKNVMCPKSFLLCNYLSGYNPNRKGHAHHYCSVALNAFPIYFISLFSILQYCAFKVHLNLTVFYQHHNLHFTILIYLFPYKFHLAMTFYICSTTTFLVCQPRSELSL